jgi:hypothetical protein
MPESVMGNLREHSLEEIWNGPLYRALRARVNSDRPPEACQHCPMVRLPHNPTSFLYNRPRQKFRLFRDELAVAASDEPRQQLHALTNGGDDQHETPATRDPGDRVPILLPSG